MKKNKISTILCLILMIVTLMGICGFTVYSFADKHTISEKENRKLAQLPELNAKNWFSGEFANGLNLYLNDHVLLRNEIIGKASGFESMLKKELPVQVVTSNDNRKDIGSDAVVLSDKIVALYINNKDCTETFIESCNILFEQMPEHINKYIMLSPTRIEYETEDLKQYSNSQLNTIYEVYTRINDDVVKVDAYSPLLLGVQNAGIDKLYFKTDHHWTAYGACFGANALLTAMGKNYVNPDLYEKVDFGGFYGFLAVMYLSDIESIPYDEFIYYNCADDIYEYAYGVEKADITECIYEPVIDPGRAGYYAFVERSYQYIVIEGGNKDGGNMLMLNDSYGNAMTPWMASQYNKIIMIDPRSYEGGADGLMKLIEDYEVDDFVISFAGLFMSSGNVGNLLKLCK